MIVKELIEELEKWPADAEVWTKVDDLYGSYVCPANEFKHVSGSVEAVSDYSFDDPWQRHHVAVCLTAREILIG